MENLIKGAISFLPSQEGTKILVRDAASSRTFLEVTLTNDQLAAMMSRLLHTDCEIRVSDLDKNGKKMEHRQFEFEYDKKENVEWICEMAMERDGFKDWTSDQHYGSQNSFFQRDGKNFARTIIRRWI